MINKELFIQNINDSTTVLQQLRVCIEQMKENIDYINNFHLYNIILGNSTSKAFLQLNLLYNGELPFFTINGLLSFLLNLPVNTYYNASGSIKVHQTSSLEYDAMGVIQRIQTLSNGIVMHGILLKPNAYELFNYSLTSENISEYFGTAFSITQLM